MTQLLSFSNLNCKANPILAGVSLLRTEIMQHGLP